MSTSKPKDLFTLEGISHLCFSKDLKQCALSKKNHLVYLYDIPNINDTTTWIMKQTLEAHVLNVSSIDWNHESNKILTASYDKTACIWSYKENNWIPESFVFNARIGYLTASWNSRGDKLVAGTGNKNLVIGYFSQESNWWTGMNIKCHKSSVVCAKIDPTSLFVISGSTDLHVYVSSCYLPLDAAFLKPEQHALSQPFGDVVYCFEAGAWATAVNWNISGSLCFAASQNSLIGVIDYLNSKITVISIHHSPVHMIIPIDDTSFFAISFNREIYLYSFENNNWILKSTVTQSDQKISQTSTNGMNSNISSEISGGVQDALKKFQISNAKKKQTISVVTEQNLSLHPTLISSLTVLPDKKLMTSDLAGFIKYYDI